MRIKLDEDVPAELTDPRTISKPIETAILFAILLLFAVMSVVGISWGLPSREIDKYLFGDDTPWSGEKIFRLAGAAEKLTSERAASRGADVDVDPLDTSGEEPIPLTATEEGVAKIYLRYRLYTYQPDEMITMMALAGMNPRKAQLDPRLYQYGGLFIYPVGGLIGACGLVGLIDVRSDVAYYLDNPDEFGKFYIVARAYSVAWGLVGVVVVFAIGRRLGGGWAGLLAALLFTLMPVVVCMAHEGKPHLPGAVLMLTAVLFAMRHLSNRAVRGGMGERSSPMRHVAVPSGRDWWLMCICCGTAVGMVLSSWPILVLIPLVALLERTGGTVKRSLAVEDAREAKGWHNVTKRTLGGIGAAAGIYLVANPYILINALVNREVLRSNFSNSLAMYEIARVGEGFVRVVELTVEGATLPIVLIGVLALIVAILRRGGTVKRSLVVAVLPLAVPAIVFFLQFVLIGAGKPAEYGRFGIFTNTAMAIGTACLLAHRWRKLHEIVNWIPATFVTAFVISWMGLQSASYLWACHVDTTGRGSRLELASYLRGGPPTSMVGVLADPAPYCCPPLSFARTDVRKFGSHEQFDPHAGNSGAILVVAVDERRWLGFRPVDDAHPLVPSRMSTLFWPRNWHWWFTAVRPWREWWVARESPITWANKPFAVSFRQWSWNNGGGNVLD